MKTFDQLYAFEASKRAAQYYKLEAPTEEDAADCLRALLRAVYELFDTESPAVAAYALYSSVHPLPRQEVLEKLREEMNVHESAMAIKVDFASARSTN